jgi:hypothetical protein
MWPQNPVTAPERLKSRETLKNELEALNQRLGVSNEELLTLPRSSSCKKADQYANTYIVRLLEPISSCTSFSLLNRFVFWQELKASINELQEQQNALAQEIR